MAHNFFDFGHHGAARTCYAEEDGKAYFWDHQSANEVQSIIDHNSRVKSVNTLGPKSKHGFLVGEIPITIYHVWQREWLNLYRPYMTWQEFLVKRLESREYRKFKSSDQKLYVPENQRTK